MCTWLYVLLNDQKELNNSDNKACVNSERTLPGLIPNPEVKPFGAESSALVTVCKDKTMQAFILASIVNVYSRTWKSAHANR